MSVITDFLVGFALMAGAIIAGMLVGWVIGTLRGGRRRR